MIHLETNADIVIRTLEKYQYCSDVVKTNARCFSQLKNFMEQEQIKVFDLATAQKWCKDKTAASGKRAFYHALLRLSDVYEHNRVLGSHLTIHGDLSEEFSETIESFIASLSSHGFLESSYRRYRESCSMFFRFCQVNGIFSLKKVCFPILRDYHEFIRESERYEAYEGCVEKMFLYLAKNCNLKYGFALFLHYARFDRCSSIEDFSIMRKARIEALRGIKGMLSSRDFCLSINAFINGIKSHNYGSNRVHAHYYYLNVLGVFLEAEDIDYSRHVADIWAEEFSARFFGKTRVKAFRHTLDLYDAFIKNGHQVPKSLRVPLKSTYLTLPDWCKTAIDSYAMMRKREGLREVTVRKQMYQCAKFCKFIVAEGITSFKELRPEHIKAFNLKDKHQSVAGKNGTNRIVYRFLIYLELHESIQCGLHNAIPCCAAQVERVVTVLSKEDKEKLDAYCCNASTPIELRDVAIFKIAMNTALRGVDIISLTMMNIDWKNKCIRIIQQKTAREHLHPVDNGTLNAIFRYLKDGRSKKADTTRVFVSSRAPYGPLSDSEACRNALKRVGTSVTDFHRIRRTYATDSLRGGATFRETAELLGHSDTATVHRYALLDDERMRLCPLSLEETGLKMDGRYTNER